MTISTELRKAGPFAGNGVTTAFPFSFKVFAASDVAVTRADTLGAETALVLNTDFTVALNHDQDAEPGGTVTLAAPLATGSRLAVTSVVPNLQPTDITNNGGFYPRVIEDALDRHVAQIQQIDEKVARALKVAITSPRGDQALPAPVAGMVVGWNETNDGLVNYPAAGNTLLAQMLAEGTANIAGQSAQGVANLRGDLADAGGASLVGFQQAGDAAVVRTVQDKLSEFVSVKDFGAVGDGLTDDSAAFQAALNSDAARIHVPAGHYKLNSGISRAGNLVLTGDGFDTLLDFSGASSGLLVSGAISRIEDLAANVVRGARSLSFVSAPSVSAGDVVCLYNPTDGSWLSDRASYHAGEYFRVHSVSGSAAGVYGEAAAGYSAAAIDVYRLDGANVLLSDFCVRPPTGASVAAVRVLHGEGVRISRLQAINVDRYTGIEVERSFDVAITDVTSVNNSPAVDDEYGITISNCQNVTISGGSNVATRHAIALGGAGAGACLVPNRNVLIHDLTLENVDISEDTGAADIHGNCENVIYDNCVIRNGLIMNGANVAVRNSKIYGVSDSAGTGWCVYGSEVRGGTFTIENCELFSRGSAATPGAIYISPSSSMSEKLRLMIRNVTCILPNGTAASRAVMLRSRGAAHPCNVHVDGFNVDAPSLMCFLFADEATLATLNSEMLIVENVVGPSGAYLLYPVASNAAVPTRQMDQAGAVDFTTVDAQINAAPITTFRYSYSKMPSATTCVSKADGGAQSLIGSAAPISIVYALDRQTIRPAIIAHTGTFAAGVAVKMHWRVGINDV